MATHFDVLSKEALGRRSCAAALVACKALDDIRDLLLAGVSSHAPHVWLSACLASVSTSRRASTLGCSSSPDMCKHEIWPVYLDSQPTTFGRCLQARTSNPTKSADLSGESHTSFASMQLSGACQAPSPKPQGSGYTAKWGAKRSRIRGVDDGKCSWELEGTDL